MTKVAVIIVAYDSVRFLDGLFATLMPAVERSRAGGLETEVIVVENASKDNTLALLRARNDITLIESAKNLGFAGGNNLGIRRAMQSGAKYVYFLNHDTEVEPDFLIEALAVMESGERVGAVQSLLLLHPEKTLVNSAGNAVHFLGLGYCLGYRRSAAEVNRAAQPEIAYPSGAGVLLCAEALGVVGVFDDEFFMYHEDLDLGWRLRLAGYRCVLAPRSVVYHKYEFSRSIKKFYWMERNRGIVLLKNLRVWSLLVLALPLLVAEVALFLAALRGGWWREKLRAYAWFLRPSSWRHICTERSKVQSTRQVGDREIVRLWTPVIEFQEVTGAFTKHVANPLMRLVWAVLRRLIV
jgi:GT2 family glycosyltransferase